MLETQRKLDMGLVLGEALALLGRQCAVRALWPGPNRARRLQGGPAVRRAWPQKGFCLHLTERAPLGVLEHFPSRRQHLGQGLPSTHRSQCNSHLFYWGPWVLPSEPGLGEWHDQFWPLEDGPGHPCLSLHSFSHACYVPGMLCSEVSAGNKANPGPWENSASIPVWGEIVNNVGLAPPRLGHSWVFPD